LQFCKDAQIVYVSSGAAYGQQPEGLAQLMEEFAFGPIDQLPSQKRDYAAAKRDGELAIQQLGKEGLRVSIARCFAFLGEYLPRDQHFAIGNFIEDGLNRRPIVVKANHIVYRSYMYSDDLVLWLMAIVKNSSQACPIYNVGSDESISILELARKIGCYLNVDVNAPRVISRVVERYVPSIEKAKMSLGLSLKYDLEESIKLTILKIQSSFK